MQKPNKHISRAFALAKEAYVERGVEVDKALAQLAKVPISLHCWQGDDVGGFENTGAGPVREEWPRAAAGRKTISHGAGLGGGLAVTGNYPGKARTPDELRADLEAALSLIPGTHRLNLHASYAETRGKHVDRNEVAPEHFKGWMDWAKQNRLGMDFNPTFFSHPQAADGFTLAHRDRHIRKFWIDHGIACRKISAAIGKALAERGIDPNKTKIIGQGELTSEDALKNMGEAGLGIITAFHYDYNHQSSTNTAFVKSYKESFGRNPDMFSAGAFDGMHVIYEALKKTGGKTDGESLVEAAKGMEWESPRGPMAIDPDTRDVVQTVYIRRAEKIGGQIVNVEFDKVENVKDPFKAAMKN